MALGNSCTILPEVLMLTSGQALYYSEIFVLINFLPAADLKYFSLEIASFIFSKVSK